MNSQPVVSVVMPVHNGEKFVKDAVESVLAQTFQDFELIVVDDGSTDSTPQILKSLSSSDDRITVHHCQRIGFTEALNLACTLARGKYLARMDADDLSLPERLAEQVQFLDAHPEVSVCGSWIKAFGTAGSQVVRYPTQPEDLKCRLLFSCGLAHPSVMMRKQLFAERGLKYQSEFYEAADYSLWVDVSMFGALANMPQVLLMYRVHASQVSEYDRQRQQEFAQEIRIRQLSSLGVRAESEDRELHRSLSTYRYRADRGFVKQSETWLLKLAAANEKAKRYDLATFSRVLADNWLAVCMGATSLGLWTFKTFVASQLTSSAPPNFVRRSKLLVKCIASNVTLGRVRITQA